MLHRAINPFQTTFYDPAYNIVSTWPRMPNPNPKPGGGRLTNTIRVIMYIEPVRRSTLYDAVSTEEQQAYLQSLQKASHNKGIRSTWRVVTMYVENQSAKLRHGELELRLNALSSLNIHRPPPYQYTGSLTDLIPYPFTIICLVETLIVWNTVFAVNKAWLISRCKGSAENFQEELRNKHTPPYLSLNGKCFPLLKVRLTGVLFDGSLMSLST